MKDQYLILLFAFGFMAAYRFTLSLDLRGILQMTLFALPLRSLVVQGEAEVTPWAYVCLVVAVCWWLADLYKIIHMARQTYLGTAPRKRMAPRGKPISAPARTSLAVHSEVRLQATQTESKETVKMVSIKPSDVRYGAVIGILANKPIYEWIAAEGYPGKAFYIGILGQGVEIGDNDVVLPPGTVYRWKSDLAFERQLEVAETA
jgi:hypothetical protein